MRGAAVTRKIMLGSLDAALVWGKRHYGGELPKSNPDIWTRPPQPVIALFIQDKTPYDAVRQDYDFQMAKRLDDPVFIIKSAEPYTRDFLDSEGIEYLEWPTNRPYWGSLASEWRNAEMRMYADFVLEYKPPKVEKPKRRKGRRIE